MAEQDNEREDEKPYRNATPERVAEEVQGPIVRIMDLLLAAGAVGVVVIDGDGFVRIAAGNGIAKGELADALRDVARAVEDEEPHRHTIPGPGVDPRLN